MKVEKFKVLLYLKKSSPDKTGKAPIMGRITVNHSMAQFSLKLSCTPSLWNPRESRLDGKSREAVECNQKIEKALLGLHSAFDSLAERKRPFDAKMVKNTFQGSMDTQMSLLAFFDDQNKQREARVGIDRSQSNLKHYLYTRHALGDFIKKKFNTLDIVFGQLSEPFIGEFQEFCLIERKLSLGTVRHYVSILKQICRKAYKEGYSNIPYFSRFKLPTVKENAPKALDRDAFEKIRNLKFHETHASNLLTRDLFLFACYTGTAYADTVSITKKNIVKDEQGSLWLEYRRKKNNCQGRVKLLPEAIALIEQYRDENRETLFPVQPYGILSKNMKALRIMANIKQDISYHAGRHSFASLITLEEGVPIETISKMLGHSDIRTTQIYAKVTPKKLFEEMDMFVKATQDLILVL